MKIIDLTDYKHSTIIKDKDTDQELVEYINPPFTPMVNEYIIFYLNGEKRVKVVKDVVNDMTTMITYIFV